MTLRTMKVEFYRAVLKQAYVEKRINYDYIRVEVASNSNNQDIKAKKEKRKLLPVIHWMQRAYKHI